MPGVSPNYRGKNPIPGYRPATQQPQHYGDGGRGRGGGMAGGRGAGDHSNPRGGNQHPWYGVFAPVGMSLPVGAPPPARPSWVPPNFSGVLGSRPGAPTQAYPVMQSPAPSAPAAPSAPSYQLPQYASPPYQAPSWDHNTMLQHAPSYGSAFPAYGGDWIMDSGATSHVTGTQGNLTTSHSPFELKSHHIIVGNGKRLPVVATGTTQLTPTPFSLNNVLVSPDIVSNLISTRSFVRDNFCSVEFDPFGFSVKDLATRRLRMRSNSLGDLYPFFGNNGSSSTTALSVSSDLWHRRLGHPSSSTTPHFPADLFTHCVSVVTGKWIFRHKLNADGSLARYKARWVVRGFTQKAGVDYGETFSPVVKPATIRVVLSLATAKSWPIHQLDVKNAFLHGELAETVYCTQPSGFVDSNLPNHVCRLNKSLYGLKQAPRTWFLRFTTFLHTLGFVSSKSDTSLLVLRTATTTAYLLLYVDDIILTASTTSTL
ncbi:hypothetical protein QYE76_066127 [Lolium multiflorum]|uniref:Reverse transcriptase Ty1/copia-type domain-containing protein n=1 Tax=Lolium multiflorum TaxID=4521 RepID=A0AAD8SA04_LOLMU|nr:hypothetical protein QYE76_066127 [Lolium multiflorum]